MPETLTADLAANVAADVEATQSLDAVSTILRVLAETTGMRISLVARVTAETWTACAVHDEAGFGLAAGDTLDIATTY